MCPLLNHTHIITIDELFFGRTYFVTSNNIKL